MAIEIKPVNLTDIPKAKGGNEAKKWQDAVNAFLESGSEAAEVFGEGDGRKVSTGLRGAVRGLDLVGKVKVVRRGNQAFLVRL